GDLRRPKPPKSPVRRSVGGDCSCGYTNVVASIRTRRMDGPSGEHDRSQRNISAAVEDNIDLACNQAPVPHNSRAMADDSGMALGSRGNIFSAIVNQLDRTLRFMGEQRGVAGNHRWVLFLAAKSAAGRSLNDDGLFVSKVEEKFDGAMNIVGALHRAEHRHLVVSGNSDYALWLDIELLLVWDAVLALDYEIGVGESFVELATANHDSLEDIVA